MCENHSDLLRRVEKIEQRQDQIDVELEAVKLSGASTKEQVKTIFETLAEIKQMLRDYTTKMETAIVSINAEIANLKQRPARNWDNIVSTVITVAVTAVVMYVIGGKP
jgi:uncharacterized membrane-anchored protein YhcB (DUF1043 family)